VTHFNELLVGCVTSAKEFGVVADDLSSVLLGLPSQTKILLHRTIVVSVGWNQFNLLKNVLIGDKAIQHR
jgi:hypothetical protein